MYVVIGFKQRWIVSNVLLVIIELYIRYLPILYYTFHENERLIIFVR